MEGVRPLRKIAASARAEAPVARPPAPADGAPAGKGPETSPPAGERAARGRAARPAPAAGIDKATLARLTRGEIAIDARLDLHGMTQAEAHRALDRALDSAVRQGLRLILVITGKGVGGDGVLRRALPGWLAAAPHASRVLRIVPAQARHGGGGAWYVYLRRKR